MIIESMEKTFVNDKLLGKTVDITLEHIQKGICGDTDKCALALAMNDTFPNFQEFNIYEGWGKMFLIRRNGDDNESMMLPFEYDKELREWISDFDNRVDSLNPIQLIFSESVNIHSSFAVNLDVVK